MNRKKEFRKIINIIKNHPIRILAGGTSGITLCFGMNKLLSLEYADLKKIWFAIKTILINNIAIIIAGICVIIIATYISFFKSKKLKSDESTDQKIIKQLGDIINNNSNIDNIEIHGHNEEWSISMSTKNKEENNSNNMYILKNNKREVSSKETKSN